MLSLSVWLQVIILWVAPTSVICSQLATDSKNSQILIYGIWGQTNKPYKMWCNNERVNPALIKVQDDHIWPTAIFLGLRSWMQSLVRRAIDEAIEGKHETTFSDWDEVSMSLAGPAVTLKLKKTEIR